MYYHTTHVDMFSCLGFCFVLFFHWKVTKVVFFWWKRWSVHGNEPPPLPEINLQKWEREIAFFYIDFKTCNPYEVVGWIQPTMLILWIRVRRLCHLKQCNYSKITCWEQRWYHDFCEGHRGGEMRFWRGIGKWTSGICMVHKFYWIQNQ